MKIKVLVKEGGKMPSIIDQGDWIDLYAAETVALKAPQAGVQHQVDNEKVRDVTFDSTLVSLGVAMQLPKGYEAVMNPRSSTYKSFFVMQRNSTGILDNSYCGEDDVWRFPVVAFGNTTIKQGDKVCQFRIQLSQKATFWQKLKWLFSSTIELEQVDHFNNVNRGGFGSTGNK